MVKKKENTNYLFKYLLLANLLQYLEAGAVPALLVSLAQSFEMTAGEQGLLGGVVYLSLGFGSPFAGYLLRHNNHKIVIGWAVTANMILATLWALTPVGYSFSTSLFILVRFLMGLCQCIICVYLPLWANESAPKAQRTAWMSYLQVICYFQLSAFFMLLLPTGISSSRSDGWIHHRSNKFIDSKNF